MRTAATVAQWIIRLCGLALVTLGVLFWTGNALPLIPLHMLIGIVLVLTLWTLAALAASAGAPPAQVAVAAVWGLVVPALGLTQDQILTGDPQHHLIRLLHLVVGLVAIGMAEGLGRAIRRSGTRAAAA
jgi:hypothetical protein